MVVEDVVVAEDEEIHQITLLVKQVVDLMVGLVEEEVVEDSLLLKDPTSSIHNLRYTILLSFHNSLEDRRR